MASHILNELKRMAGEYGIAAMEAANADVRQLFERLLQRTLSDQWQLFQQMNRSNMYGQPTQAHMNDLQQEAQHHRKTRQELQQLLPLSQGAPHQPVSGQQGRMQYGGMPSEPTYGSPRTPLYTGTGTGSASSNHMVGGYTSTAGDGVYGNVSMASTADIYGASEMADESDASESAGVHTTGSHQLTGHSTGSSSSHNQSHTGSSYIG